jgi:hypothetical protein
MAEVTPGGVPPSTDPTGGEQAGRQRAGGGRAGRQPGAGPAAAARDAQRGRARSHPPAGDDPGGELAVLAAIRALGQVETRADAAQVLRTAVRDLGGAIVPAHLAGDDAIPVDVSLGDGEPQVVVAEPLSVAALQLTEHLPLLVEHALLSAARCDRLRRDEGRPALDPATGLAAPTETRGRVAAAAVGDVVCVLRLTGLAGVAADERLHAFGTLLRSVLRVGEFCGRYDDEDAFAVVLSDVPLETAVVRLRRLATRWHRRDRGGGGGGGEPAGVSVVAGVAAVDERGADAAARAALAALGRAGASGVEPAAAADYVTMGEA